MIVMRRWFLRSFSTDVKLPRELYHDIPNLDPTKRRPTRARLDLSGHKTVFFERYKKYARLSYAFEESSLNRIPFPEGTRGYLYYHVPPNGTMAQGELRFRLAESDGKFKTGEDLRMPDGSVWNVSLERMSKDPDMQAFLERLTARRPGRRDAIDSDLHQLEGWVSLTDGAQRRVRKVPNLIPGTLRDEDFMNISGHARPIFRHLRRTSALSRLVYSSSYSPFEKYSPFPIGTRGFLYYYMPPVTDNLPAEVASLTGEIRFRLTSTPFAESFAEGVDLTGPNGLPWCIPLWHIVNTPNMLPFLTKLTWRTKNAEPVLSEETIERAKNLFKPGHRYFNTIFQLDQPIAVKLNVKSVRLSVMNRQGNKLVQFGLRLHNVLPEWKKGKGYKKSEVGSAHICISYSSTDFFVVRLLRTQSKPGAVPFTILKHTPARVNLVLRKDQPRDILWALLPEHWISSSRQAGEKASKTARPSDDPLGVQTVPETSPPSVEQSHPKAD